MNILATRSIAGGEVKSTGSYEADFANATACLKCQFEKHQPDNIDINVFIKTRSSITELQYNLRSGKGKYVINYAQTVVAFGDVDVNEGFSNEKIVYRSSIPFEPINIDKWNKRGIKVNNTAAVFIAQQQLKKIFGASYERIGEAFKNSNGQVEIIQVLKNKSNGRDDNVSTFRVTVPITKIGGRETLIKVDVTFHSQE